MSSSPAQVDIVIPVYNEAGSIGQAIRLIVEKVKVPYRLHLAYDFDEDNTLPVARDVASDLGVEINFLKNAYGRGALNAIKTGLHKTTAEYVVVTMADLSDPPEVINHMYEAAEKEGADVVCASRYMRGGAQIGGPLLKKTMSRAAGLTLCWFARVPTHDATNSFKLYRRKVIDSIAIESTGGFELGLELVVKAHVRGFKVGEVPTTWRDRSAGESRFKLWHWLPKYLRWYFYAYRKA
jgi:glycosyltransferase involved in cell wall biosynthesis